MTLQGHAVLLMRLLFPALVFARIDHRKQFRDRARVQGSRWIRLWLQIISGSQVTCTVWDDPL